MKTQIQIIRKRFSASAILFILASVMGINFLSSCQKEDTSSMAPSGSPFASSEESRSSLVPIPSIQLVKETNLDNAQPSYSVSVFENGEVWFDGKSNTAVHGMVKSHIDQTVFNELIELFSTHHFMEMENNYAGSRNGQHTTTTLAFEHLYKSVSDHGMHMPAELLSLQKEIIHKLKIEKLISSAVIYQREDGSSSGTSDLNGKILGSATVSDPVKTDVVAIDNSGVLYEKNKDTKKNFTDAISIKADEMKSTRPVIEVKILNAGKFDSRHSTGQTRVNISELQNQSSK